MWAGTPDVFKHTKKCVRENLFPSYFTTCKNQTVQVVLSFRAAINKLSNYLKCHFNNELKRCDEKDILADDRLDMFWLL